MLLKLMYVAYKGGSEGDSILHHHTKFLKIGLFYVFMYIFINVYDIMYLFFSFICEVFVALNFYILCYNLGSLVVSIKKILRPPHAAIKYFWIHPLVHDIKL